MLHAHSLVFKSPTPRYMSTLTLQLILAYVHFCRIPLLHNNDTIMNAHETPILKTFELCTLQNLYNLSTML
jgi:hypothetical protein